MDSNSLIILQADIKAQINLIQRVFEQLLDRANGLQPNDIVRLESIAYNIHNLYNAMEDLLKVVATHFENNIADSAKWHSLLLQRMTQEIQGSRPALLSQETYQILNTLRGFRHFFRHAYGTPIDYDQLKINLDKSLALVPLLEADVNHFLQTLSAIK
jgi:hypothetical protein